MLSLLRVKNLAIIEELEVEFGLGLNVITGETGSGKSVLLKSLELLTGKRATAELIRTGAASCEIEGLFQLSQADRELLLAHVSGLDGEELHEELVLRRVIDSQGKSRMYLNGRIATTSLVQQIANQLVDFTGQHQHQVLLEGSANRQFVDRFGVEPKLLEDVRTNYAAYAEARGALERFVNRSTAQAEQLRRLEFEVAELSQLELRVGEREELESELNRLTSVDSLRELVGGALALLEDSENSPYDQLRRLSSLLRDAADKDSALAEAQTTLAGAENQLAEVGLALDRYAARLELDPARLEAVRSRISEIARVERKYGKAADLLVEYLVKTSQELELLSGGAQDEEQLRARLLSTERALIEVEEKLGLARRSAAAKLAPMIEAELAKVNMQKARFYVAVEDGEHSALGRERVEFRLAANPGSDPMPLASVASGGELSRVLLVLKAILNEQTGASFQIFDEIDTGIGGAVAHVVGEKLKTIATYAQVLLVTHAPQIASLADHHFVIRKESSKQSTRAKVQQLTPDERVHEVARMLAGKKISVEFENSARELLGYNKKKGKLALVQNI